MKMLELIMKRRSVRNFESRPVPENILEELLAAANNAPTGGNLQPLSVIVVREPQRRAELADIVGGQPWVKNAPLSMVFCLDFYRIKRWASMFNVHFRGEEALAHFLIGYADIMCAAQTVVLLAESHGLGSVYIGTIQDGISRARAYFDIPEYVLPMMVLTLGYPRSVPGKVPKLRTETVVHMEKYTRPSDGEIAESFETKYGSVEDNFSRYLERTFVEAVEAEAQQESWVGTIEREMKRLAIKSNAEFLFRLRYPSDAMVAMNEKLFESFREAGFNFFGGS